MFCYQSKNNLLGSILPKLDREWDIPLGERGGGDIKNRIVEQIATSHIELSPQINHLDKEFLMKDYLVPF